MAIEQVLHASIQCDWEDAALAIMTTDTFPKGAACEFELDGKKISIAGIAKGSGMIAPNMATMLSYVATDLPISASVLQQIWQNCIDQSFNAISVDSDTSTSDAALLFATGKAQIDPVHRRNDPRLDVFETELLKLCQNLAEQIIRDGEGAKKLIRVTVKGGKSIEDCQAIAKSIGDSPLVKTAIAGEDANWGRVIMALGKSGVKINPAHIDIEFAGILTCEKGEKAAFDEKELDNAMRKDEIGILVDLHHGSHQAQYLTCDLTHGYIDINADYRS